MASLGSIRSKLNSEIKVDEAIHIRKRRPNYQPTRWIWPAMKIHTAAPGRAVGRYEEAEQHSWGQRSWPITMIASPMKMADSHWTFGGNKLIFQALVQMNDQYPDHNCFFSFPSMYYGSVLGMNQTVTAVSTLLQFPLYFWMNQGHFAVRCLHFLCFGVPM